MTNNEKEEVNDYIANSDEIFSHILACFQSKNLETQTYAIRIIGNILAEKEDYASKLAHYKILEAVFPVLRSRHNETRRDACWLIGNYTVERAAACEALCSEKLIERLGTMLKDEQFINAKIELYFVFLHLVSQGDKKMAYALIHQAQLLQQCSYDIEIEDIDLTLAILQLIDHVIKVGAEFVSFEDESTNEFVVYINSSSLRKSIQSKTFHNNQEVSAISSDIIDALSMESWDDLMAD